MDNESEINAAPSTSTEAFLVRVAQDVIRRADVAVTEDLFDAHGLQSTAADNLTAAVRTVFSGVTLADLYECRTMRSLARRIDASAKGKFADDIGAKVAKPPPREQAEQFCVLLNEEGYYSVWPAAMPITIGWSEAGYRGDREACIAHVDAVWTALRPVMPDGRGGAPGFRHPGGSNAKSGMQCANPPDGFPLSFVEFSRTLGHYDHTERDVSLIQAMLPLPEFQRVVDICCGFGRMSGALHGRGYEVVGLDLSSQHIELARRVNTGPDYVVSDMRHVPGAPFDAAINLYTSFGYLPTEQEDFAALQAWAAALRPGGRLIMELADMDRARARLDLTADRTIRERGGVLQEFIMDWATGVFKVTYRRAEQTLQLYTRLYEKERLAELLKQAGFSEVELFGGFERGKKEPGDNLVIVAVR